MSCNQGSAKALLVSDQVISFFAISRHFILPYFQAEEELDELGGPAWPDKPLQGGAHLQLTFTGSFNLLLSYIYILLGLYSTIVFSGTNQAQQRCPGQEGAKEGCGGACGGGRGG